MIDYIAQWWIFLFGIASITLVSCKQRFGFILGLAAQPGFLVTAYINHQPGLFLLSIPYTLSWMIGIYNWYIKKH
ncbi:MAG: hypothetical protein ACTSRG_25045 [Candidatus Helarchaeota archaeon]